MDAVGATRTPDRSANLPHLVGGRTVGARFKPGDFGVLTLQRLVGNRAVAGLLQPVVDLSRLLSMGESLVAQALHGGEGLTENNLTNQLFWFQHPEVQGQRLPPGSPLAPEWLKIRDNVVRPLLRPKPQSGQASGETPPAGAPPGLAPADAVAAETATVAPGGATASSPGVAAASATPTAAGLSGAATAGEGDKYFRQGVGRYKDTTKEGVPRLWLNKTSGANICNVTSLTMALVSMAGEGEVRARMVAMLRSGGMHAGAQVEIGGKFVPLITALSDSSMTGRINLVDLVTAVAIGKAGSYGDVTVAGTLARIAREAGIAKGAQVATGAVELTNPKVRESAKQMLAEGKRVVAGTVGHYVYLIEVRDDGVVLHDPAGARLNPNTAFFLHTGTAAQVADEFLDLGAGSREKAVQRVKTNPQASSLINDLLPVAGLRGAARNPALQTVTTAHSGQIQMGALNFYANSEFAENNLRLRVTLSAQK